MTTVTDEQTAKVTRNLHSVMERVLKGSLDPDDLVRVLGHLMGKGKRAENLLAYARENCPNIIWTATEAPKAKRAGKKSEAGALVNPAEFFISDPRFWVDPDLAINIDLSPVKDDVREPKSLFALSSNLNDTAIAKQAGGVEALTAKRTTLPQLMRECKRALTGEPSLIKKGQYLLFYLVGKSGVLCPVSVRWSGGTLYLDCFRFDQRGYWPQDRVVCGN